MNARPCWASTAERQHLRQQSAEDIRADGETDVTNEIADTMHRALCLGENVKVPSWKAGKGLYGDDSEVQKDALELLWEHLSDSASEQLLLALLRTNSPEAQALVQYAAKRHAWFNASDINNIRDRVAQEL